MLSNLPKGWVKEIIADYPQLGTDDFVQIRLDAKADWLYSQLSKRWPVQKYADLGLVDVTKVPKTIKQWLAWIEAAELLVLKGSDPNQLDASIYEKRADTARSEIITASNSADGGWDLDIRDDDQVPGSFGGPISYSEASPYVSARRHAERARREDIRGRGTYGGRRR